MGFMPKNNAQDLEGKGLGSVNTKIVGDMGIVYLIRHQRITKL